MLLPTPIYRFFSKKDYATDLVQNGRMRFTPTAAFANLNDPRYRDEGEKYYRIKIPRKQIQTIIVDGEERKIEGGSIHSTHRRIDDAWAFCCTTSIVSSARKQFATYIKDFGLFRNKLEQAVQDKFEERLLIMFGPVAYYNRHMDLFSEVNPPPYFSKDEQFMSDHEFRIVIIPSEKIYNSGPVESITFELDNPDDIFGETLIADRPKDSKK